jgi:hypothetical protein
MNVQAAMLVPAWLHELLLSSSIIPATTLLLLLQFTALLLQVRIFSPARTAGQQGQGNTIFAKARPWRIAFDTQQK